VPAARLKAGRPYSHSFAIGWPAFTWADDGIFRGAYDIRSP
jgi:hypothetical protein